MQDIVTFVFLGSCLSSPCRNQSGAQSLSTQIGKPSRGQDDALPGVRLLPITPESAEVIASYGTPAVSRATNTKDFGLSDLASRKLYTRNGHAG